MVKKKYTFYSLGALCLCVSLLALSVIDVTQTPIGALSQKTNNTSANTISTTTNSNPLPTKPSPNKKLSLEHIVKQQHIINLATVASESNNTLINSLPFDRQKTINRTPRTHHTYTTEINAQARFISRNPPTTLDEISQILLGSYELMSKHLPNEFIEQKYGSDKQFSKYLIKRTRILNDENLSSSLKQQYINNLNQTITDSEQQQLAQIDNMQTLLDTIPITFNNENDIEKLQVQLTNLSDNLNLAVDMPGDNWDYELQAYNIEKQNIINTFQNQEVQNRLITELRQVSFSKSTDSRRARNFEIAQNIVNAFNNQTGN